MPAYECEIKGTAAALDAYLNEYHMYSSTGASHCYSTNIRAWMEKENLFRIKISASDKAVPGDPVQFSVLAVVSEGDRCRTLAQMSFPGGIAAPDIAVLPFDTLGKSLAAGNNLSFVCDEAGAILEKPWKADRRLISNPRDIYDLYATIQRNFVESNVAGIMGLSRARITFCAKLFDDNRADYERQVRDNLSRAFAKQPHWKTIQQPERELTVHEFLPGKVVRVLDLNGNPPLRTVADENGVQFGYDIILAMTAEGLTWIM
jgi:hypothetical protein